MSNAVVRGAKMRHTLVSLFVSMAVLGFASTANAAGSVRFSYEKIEVGSEVQWALLPKADLTLAGAADTAKVSKAFDALKKAKRSTYRKSSIQVKGSSAARAKVTVTIDPAASRYALIIMAETVYTLTELGVPSVSFPGYATGAMTRGDVPFPAYTLTVPLWKALPNLSSRHVDVIMPDGSARSSEEVIKAWRKKDKELLKNLYAYLDGKDSFTVTSVAKLLPKLKVAYADEVTPLLKHASPAVRTTALEVLDDQKKNTAVLEAVVAMMNAEKDKALAEKAAAFLGAAKDKKFKVQEQFYHLAKGDEKKSAEAAAALAGYAKDDRVPKALATALEDKRKPVAMAAAEALEKLGAAETQKAGLKNAKIDAEVRLTLARGLSEDKASDDAIAGLTYRADNGAEDEAVKAITGLGGIKGDDAQKALDGYLKNDKRYLRRTAAAQLQERKSVASLPAFAAAVKANVDAELMENTGYAILASQSLKTILDEAKSSNNIVKRMAYRALGELAQKGKADAKVFAMLEKGLTNRDVLIRGASARAIGSFANENAATALKKVVNDKSADVRADVAVALGRLKGATMLEELNAYLDDKSDKVKAAAVSSLAQRSEAGAWDKIKAHAKSTDEGLRAASLKALAALVSREDKQGVREVISLLSGGVSDNSAVVRTAAIEALGTFKEASAVTGIALQLNATEEDVRLAAIAALGKTGHPSATELLISVVADPDKKVRATAIRALGDLGGKGAKSTLQERQKNEKDEDLARLIKETLRRM